MALVLETPYPVGEAIMHSVPRHSGFSELQGLHMQTVAGSGEVSNHDARTRNQLLDRSITAHRMDATLQPQAVARQ